MNKKQTMNKKRKRRSFNDEFKIQAVKMVTEQGYNVAEAARQLEISSNTLQRWKGQLSYKEETSESD